MQGIPADDTAFRIPQGESAYMEPTVYAIGPTDTMLNFIGMPGFDRASPRGFHPSEIIRMNSIPTFQFLKSPAQILEELTVDEFDLTHRCHGTNEAGNAVDDQTQTLFTRTQSFLSALPVVDI